MGLEPMTPCLQSRIGGEKVTWAETVTVLVRGYFR